MFSKARAADRTASGNAMLAADPWSACNPNFAFDDASVTRGKDRSHKKQRGDGNQRNQPARASFVGSKRG